MHTRIMRWKMWFNSLRTKLFAGLLFTLVPLIVVLIVMNFYSTQVVRNQVAQSNKNLLGLYLNQIDRNLQEVDNYLINLSQTDLDLLEFDTYEATNEINYTKAKLRLFNTLVSNIDYYKAIDLFFLYSAKNKELVLTKTFGNSYEEREDVVNEIKLFLEEPPVYPDIRNWNSWKSRNGSHYLYHVIQTGEVYVGAWVNVDKLIVPLQLIDLGENGAAILANDKLEPMNEQELIQAQGIRLEKTAEPYTLSGSHSEYLVMGEQSKKGSFYLFALLPEEMVMEKLPYLQRISFIISIGALTFFLLFIIFMRHVFLRPVNRIVKAMRKLGDGDLNARIEPYPVSTEYAIMNETYNRMITEIEHLKIDVYEEKLKHQRAELKHLQLQINPHFFLNSLNIIYNLATVKDYALIQEMSKCLVAYFRFMFRGNSYFVSLKDELIHTRNYLRIQELRFPGTMTYEVQAPEEWLSVEVPPLIVQTIVENIIKHAVNMDEPIQIRVTVQPIEPADTGGYRRILICIEDTGPGFPAEVLEQLYNRQELMNDEGEHIGIWNSRRRLQLLYGDKADISFYNREPTGAGVKIRIPVDIHR